MLPLIYFIFFYALFFFYTHLWFAKHLVGANWEFSCKQEGRGEIRGCGQAEEDARGMASSELETPFTNGCKHRV